jgi:hypothetical protein
MSELSRRDFLKASAGAVGASVATSRVHASPKVAKVPPSRAKIFTVFGHTNPSTDDTSVVPTSDADLLTRILRRSRKELHASDDCIERTRRTAPLRQSVSKLPCRAAVAAPLSLFRSPKKRPLPDIGASLGGDSAEVLWLGGRPRGPAGVPIAEVGVLVG